MCVSAWPTEFGKTITGINRVAAELEIEFYANTVGSKRSRVGIDRRLRQAISRPDAPQLLGGAPANWQVDEETKLATPKNWIVDEEPQGNALLMPIFGVFETIKIVDTTSGGRILKDIREALQPQSRGPKSASFGLLSADRSVDVVIEEFDVYTVVRARRPGLIPEALEQVDILKRPKVNAELFKALDEWYQCPFAICCFNVEDEAEAKPMAFSYQPLYADHYLIYTLDEHSGGIPNLNGNVGLDHVVFVGSYDMPEDKGIEVYYSDFEISPELRRLLPTRVLGQVFEAGTNAINGDILIPASRVRQGKWDAYRVVPPHAPERKPIKLSEALR